MWITEAFSRLVSIVIIRKLVMMYKVVYLAQLILRVLPSPYYPLLPSPQVAGAVISSTMLSHFVPIVTAQHMQWIVMAFILTGKRGNHGNHCSNHSNHRSYHSNHSNHSNCNSNHGNRNSNHGNQSLCTYTDCLAHGVAFILAGRQAVSSMICNLQHLPTNI